MTGSDPWADDSIPASSGLGEIRWDERSTSRTDDPGHPPPGTDGPTPGRPRRAVVAVAALVAIVAVVAVGITASTIGDDDVDEATATTLARLDTATTDAPPPDPADDGDTDDPGERVGSDPVDELFSGPADVERGADTTSTFTVDLPPAVAAITESTEVVGITSNDQVITIAVPAGIVQVVDLGDTGGIPASNQVVATPTFTLVSSGAQTFTIIGPTGELTRVDATESFAFGRFTGFDISQRGWVRRADGTDAVVVVAFGGDRPAALLTVDADGDIDVLDDGSDLATSFSPRASGAMVVTDAGGTYRVDDDGMSKRVGSGFTLAAAGDRIFGRECDEQRRCEYRVTDLESGTGGAVEFDEVFAALSGASLSPAGSALSYDSFENGRERRIVVFGSDPVDVERGVRPFGDGSGWAADSSGEFLIEEGSGLVFVDATTREVSPIEVELDEQHGVGAVSVRHVSFIDDGSVEP